MTSSNHAPRNIRAGIFIALGASIPSPAGPPATTLNCALQVLASKSVTILAISPFYESEAWPDPSDPVFVNAVASIATPEPPEKLLNILHEVETAFGRKRSVKNAPRALDLDLLDYDGIVRASRPRLPHPRIESRAFVLLPLSDLAPGWRHPVSGLGVGELIDALPAAARAGVRPLGPKKNNRQE